MALSEGPPSHRVLKAPDVWRSEASKPKACGAAEVRQRTDTAATEALPLCSR